MARRNGAVVLSGGGNAGQAWMAGVVTGLMREGIDLGAAGLIVGTSAGSRVGAQLAAGVLRQAVEEARRSGIPSATAYATLPQFVRAATRIIAKAPDQWEA